MPKIIKALCAFSSICAGICLLAIAGIVLSQIVSRMLGTSLPSTDDFAAWAMAGAVFLALPSAFLNGSHIKVTLVVDRFSGTTHTVLVRAAHATTLGVFLAATWFASVYVYESYIYGDTSQGVIAIQLWIPQILMLAGMFFALPVLLYLTISGAGNLPSGTEPRKKDSENDT